jgi:hypothetical protein
MRFATSFGGTLHVPKKGQQTLFVQARSKHDFLIREIQLSYHYIQQKDVCWLQDSLV